MAILNTTLCSVAAFLQSSIYEIPAYQREYAWIDGEQVEDFWIDLSYCVNDGVSQHFLGQIVIHVEEKLDGTKRYYIIDGQQRTTTIVIMLSAMRDIINEMLVSIPHTDLKYMAEDIEIKFIGRHSSSRDELRLILSQIDRDFFKNRIQKSASSYELTKPSHERILKAYVYLKNKIESELSSIISVEDKYLKLRSIFNSLLHKFQVLTLQTDKLNEAYIIFETLNHRGKDLEVSDLLKNHLFRTSENNIDLVRSQWDKLIKDLDSLDITKYLRTYWNARYSFVREKDLYTRIRKIINNPKDCNELLITLNNISSAYLCINDPENNNDVAIFNDCLSSLERLKIFNAKTFYPLLLAVYLKSLESPSDVSEKEVVNLVRKIETLFFRNMIIAGKVANKYELIFSNLAHAYYKENITLSQVIEAITKEIIDDEEFSVLFQKKNDFKPPIAKMILREVENILSPEKIVLNISNIHLEHIMPQKLSQDWQVDSETHDNNLNKIGNLTLILDKWNKSMSNKSFIEKKSNYEKSQITVTQWLLKYDHWDYSLIEERSQNICDIALTVWSI